MSRMLYTDLVLRKHSEMGTINAVTDQQSSIDFNQRVGANLARIRKAAGLSQADLANRLTLHGLPFHQPTILKVEKGTRPLKFDEACAIAGELGVNLASLAQYIDDEQAGDALAQIQRSNLQIARTKKGIEEIREQAQQNEKDAYKYLERVTAVKQEAEQRLRDAGGFQDTDGRWWWHTENGEVQLFVDAHPDLGYA